MYVVIWMNVMNEAVSQVHVMTESNCTEVKNQIKKVADEIVNHTMIRWETMEEKLVCVPSRTGYQPTYGDFFAYAHEQLAGSLVLLANGDIVFDETLRLVKPERIMTGEHAFFLAVKSPAPNGDYKAVFGTECSLPVQCAVGTWQVGWQGVPGLSWDAFIFAAPLPKAFPFWNEGVHMNYMGAEHVAAYAFQASGIQLFDPCEHINAFHWHCQGQKMHGSYAVDHSHLSVDHLYPCHYCPSITMPKGYVKRQDLCRLGSEVWLPGLSHVFRIGPVQARACCAADGACRYMNMQWAPACKGSDDVNCIIWENSGYPYWS
jgi:hypothetical protein